MSTPEGNNNDSTAEYIKTYYEWLKGRIDFLSTLHNDGHKSEAILLCCCYVEGLGSFRYSEKRPTHRFVSILEEYGEYELFGYINTTQLKKAFYSRKLKEIGTKIEVTLNNHSGQLQTKKEILTLLEPLLESKERDTLINHLYKGTIAAIVYNSIRCRAAHNLGSSINLSFSKTTFKGEPVPEITFHILYEALKKIYLAMKERGIASNSWSGFS